MLIISDSNYDFMDCYILCDQPMVCALCGARTDFLEISDTKQVHECLNQYCRYRFITEE